MVRHIKEIALVFLKLGFIAFGGPAAHVALMEDEIVTKRKWMDRQYFLDLVGATNLIPGPNSTEMALLCGYQRAGLVGLITAGACFILPAVLITGLLAYLYLNYGSLPSIEPFVYGIKPAVIAIIINAIFKFGEKALKTWELGLIGILVIIASLSGVNEITSILSGGILGMLFIYFSGKKITLKSIFPFFLFKGLKPSAIFVSSVLFISNLTNYSITKLFLVFLKIGAVLFGSGYVLIAFLDGELVKNLKWLTRKELLDAVAIGQFTPGPVLSTAAFIGYQIDGVAGAIAATIGIFLPSFIFVLIIYPVIPLLRKSKITSVFLDAVNISAVAIMAVVTFRLSQDILIDWKAWVIAILSCGAVFLFKKINSAWIILGGALLGYLLFLF